MNDALPINNLRIPGMDLIDGHTALTLRFGKVSLLVSWELAFTIPMKPLQFCKHPAK
jgi:hypothetical protein